MAFWVAKLPTADWVAWLLKADVASSGSWVLKDSKGVVRGHQVLNLQTSNADKIVSPFLQSFDFLTKV
jgi:hypothetical protein